MVFRFARSAALAAVASMAVTPLAAADLPQVPTRASVAADGVFDPNATNVEQYRRWRHRDRVDAGDVIAGVVVLGTIAAVASAASKAKQERAYRYPQRYPLPDDRYDYRSRSPEWQGEGAGGIDRAIDMCASEVERSARVASVEEAQRTAAGWRVSGRLGTGEGFTCSIGNDGRIDRVDYGSRGAAVDRQWTDERYAAARQAEDGAAVPSYPGGPIGSEVQDDDARPEFPG